MPRTQRKPLSSMTAPRGNMVLGPMSSAAEKLAIGLGSMVGKRKRASMPKKQPKKKSRREPNQLASIPLARSSAMRNSSSSVATTGKRTEFVIDLGTPSAPGVFATLLDAPLNPGNSRLFPSAVANADLYEQFRFKSLSFHYRPSTTLVGPGGVIAMYIDYDPDDPAVSSMPALMANESASITPIYSEIDMQVDRSNQWYFQHQSTTNSYDAASRQNNPGSIRVVCDKVAANVSCGYLFVTYEIEFRHPKPPQSLVLSTYVPSTELLEVGGTGGPLVKTFQLQMSLSGDSYVNRGFPLEDHISGEDDVVALGSTNWLDPCCNGPVHCVPNFIVHATTNTDPTHAATFLLELLGSAPNNTETVFASASTTAGGPVDLTPVYTDVTIAAGSRIRLRVTISQPGGSTIESNIRILSGTVTISAIGNQDVGSRRHLPVSTSSSSPSTIFSLPVQLEDAIAFLSTLSGSVMVSSIPSRFEEIHDFDPEEVKSLRRLLARTQLSLDTSSHFFADEEKEVYYPSPTPSRVSVGRFLARK